MEEKKEIKIVERLIRLNEVKEIRRFGSFIKVIYFGNVDHECVEYENEESAKFYFDRYIHNKIKEDTDDVRHDWILVSNNPSLL